MWDYIEDYIKTYSVCIQNKSKHYQPYELLKQLPIPLQP